MTTDFDDIRKRRLKNLTTPIKGVLKYSPEESKATCYLTGSPKKISQLLIKARKDHLMLSAYLKYRLNCCHSFSDIIETIRKPFKKHGIKFADSQQKNDTDSSSSLADQIYAYCYNNGLINPEDDVNSIPLPWLGKQIEQDPENPRWLTLLKTILRINLLKPKGIFKIRQQLEEYIPNPLHADDKSWTSEEIERFAGTARLTQHLATPETFGLYRSCKKKGSTKKAGQLHEAARKGYLEAQKSVIAKRVQKRGHLSGFLGALKRCKESTPLFVNGKYQEADKTTVIDFINQHFTKDKKKTMIGCLAYTDQELLDNLTNQQISKKSANGEIYHRLRSRKDNTRFLKQFICENLKNKRPPRTIVYDIKQAGIKYKGESLFTLNHLQQLFKPGENDAIEKIFDRTTDVEELFERFPKETGGTKRRTQLNLFARCRVDRELTLRYLKLCRKHSNLSQSHFCWNHANLLNKHKIPTFTEGLPLWTFRSIKQVTDSVTPITPKRKPTPKKTKPTTHSEVVKKYWPREKWCGEQWWSSSSKFANFAENHRFDSIQELEKANPALYRWLERMNQSLIKAKTNKAAKALYPNEFTGTVLTNPHINTMVGWINDSLNKMGLATLQNLPFQQNIEG